MSIVGLHKSFLWRWLFSFQSFPAAAAQMKAFRWGEASRWQWVAPSRLLWPSSLPWPTTPCPSGLRNTWTAQDAAMPKVSFQNLPQNLKHFWNLPLQWTSIKIILFHKEKCLSCLCFGTAWDAVMSAMSTLISGVEYFAVSSSQNIFAEVNEYTVQIFKLSRLQYCNASTFPFQRVHILCPDRKDTSKVLHIQQNLVKR